MNKLGIPLLVPMPAPAARRGPARPGGDGERQEFDRALDQALGRSPGKADRDRPPPSTDQAAADPERPDAPAPDGSGPTDASVDDGAEAESSAPVDTTADESEAG
ncbi:MAG: hypothetical protein AAFN30_13200, partial [Actinomycetota bacterium]